MTEPTSAGIVPWPDDVAATYRSAGLWEGRSIFDVVRDAAQDRAEVVALVDGAMRMPYRELIDRAEAAARRLADLGIGHDDRVVVQLPNCWEFVVLTLACFRAGVIPVMALPAHREQELRHIAALSESVAIVMPSELHGFDHESLGRTLLEQVDSLQHLITLGDASSGSVVSLDGLLSPFRPDEPERELAGSAGGDVAVFLLSGGTTGLPKLITRTHDDYAYNVRATSHVAGLSESTVYLVALPAGHNFPLACPGLLGALFAGGRVVIVPSPEPQRAFETIRRESVTITALVPAVVKRWIDSVAPETRAGMSSLRVIQVGGSRLADELAARVEPVLGAQLQQVFGMAEGLINMTRLDDPDEVILSTQGRPVSDADEVKVVDDDGAEVPAGSTGVLLARGPYTPRGYYRSPVHNTASFTEDGWYISGDLVERRSGGNLVVQGRTKDMINRGGEKISGEEVENAVYRNPRVIIAAAVAMPDPVVGERVCVFTVLKPGEHLTLDDIHDQMRSAGLAAFKFPERLQIVDTIPLTKVGKVDKSALRAAIANTLATEAAIYSPDKLQHDITK